MSSWLVQNALFVVPLAACAAVVCRLLRPRPAVCHALWLVVLIKLLVPPLPLWNAQWLDRLVAYESSALPQPVNADAIPLAPMAAKSNHAGRARLMEVIVVDPREIPTQQDNRPASPSSRASTKQSPEKLSDAPPESDQEQAIASTSIWASVRLAILSLWALGAGLAVVCHLRRVVRLRLALRSSAPATAAFCVEVALHCSKLGINVPRVRLCTGLPCPMVFALPRATLVWPAALENRLDAAGVQAVLVHELAHLKRRDHLTAWLEIAVACLWWWHPVAWWARRELRAYAELSCDAWVVAQLPTERGRYARALVDVCEFISLAKPASAPAVGMARGNRRFFERRLHMILRQRIATRMSFVAWIAILAVAVLVLPGFSTGQESASTNTESSRVSIGEPPASDDDSSAATPLETPKAANDAAEPLPTAPATESSSFRLSNTSTTATRSTMSALADSDDELSEELRAVARELASVRHRGKRIETRMSKHVDRVLGELFERFRANGATDENVVREAFAWILKRTPSQYELKSWSEQLKSNNASVGQLLATLLQGSEFKSPPVPRQTAEVATVNFLESSTKAGSSTDPKLRAIEVLIDLERSTTKAGSSTDATLGVIEESVRLGRNSTKAGPSTDATAAIPGKKARAQTLLRVVYDMPRDKGEALARFLKDQVEEGHVDVRTVETGLVITAEENIQRTIVGVVSLMLGEPIALELGNVPPLGNPMRQTPVYIQHSGSSGGPPGWISAPVAPDGLPTGRYQPAPAQPAGKVLRPRTVVEPGSTTPTTVYEEEALDGKATTDPNQLLPKLAPSTATESTELPVKKE